MTNRISRIETVLIEHQHLSRGVCTCGHVTGLGRSLKKHPAEMVDAALSDDAHLLAAAEAKLAAIEDLCNAAVQHSEESPSRLFSGEPFPALLTAVGVLGILNSHDDATAVARWNLEERSGVHD